MGRRDEAGLRKTCSRCGLSVLRGGYLGVDWRKPNGLCRACKKLFHRERRRNRYEYAGRNAVLAQLGFRSYRDYLESALWKAIRLRALAKAKYRCKICGRHATQVHHTRYTIQELRGESIKHLRPLCADCHRRVEFQDGVKLTGYEAMHRYYSLL